MWIVPVSVFCMELINHEMYLSADDLLGVAFLEQMRTNNVKFTQLHTRDRPSDFQFPLFFEM